MGVTSANRREAVKRRQFFEPMATDTSLSPRRRQWQAMRWVLAEAKKFTGDDVEKPTDRLVRLAKALNRVNEGRRS